MKSYKPGTIICAVKEELSGLGDGDVKKIRVDVPIARVRMFVHKIGEREGVKFATFTDDDGNLYVQRIESHDN